MHDQMVLEKDFIEKYEWAYFPVNDKYINNISESKYKVDKEKKGIPSNLNTTKSEIEDYFFEKKQWPLDKCALAWKAGKLTQEFDRNHKPIIKDEEKDGFQVGQRNIKIYYERHQDKDGKDKTGLNEYIDYLKGNAEEIIDPFNRAVEELRTIDRASNEYSRICKLLEEMYNYSIYENGQRKTKNIIAPDGIGSVYAISMLFFLSNGRIPIYDQFAHKAVKALYFEISSDNIFIGSAPGKTESHIVAGMYTEYLWLLNEVFHVFDNTEKERFVERPLDRALWVYGHCTKRYHGE